MTDIKLENFGQIGIVCRDIEKAAEMYRELFQFKGKINIVEQSASVTCRGVKGTYKMKKIMQHFGDKQFEVVEIVEAKGPNLYSEFLDEGREGLHHLGIYTKKGEELKEAFKKKYNVDVIQVGKVGKLTFSYLDTISYLGYYIELLEF